MRTLYFCLMAGLGLSLNTCQAPTNATAASDIHIDSTDIDYFLITLAYDDFWRRKPFTEGETKTINFLKSEFEKMGITPGNDPSYFQEVPLVEDAQLYFEIGQKLAGESRFPKWKEGSGFKAIREKSMQPKG